MAISTYKTFLMTSEDGSDWKKVIDIKEFPDLGGEPEMLETTTLSDHMTTNILGIQSLDALSFVANYDITEYKRLRKDFVGKDVLYAVWFGGTGQGETLVPTGDQGKFKFRGEMSAYPTGGGVNEVVDLQITIAASTPIDLDETPSGDLSS